MNKYWKFIIQKYNQNLVQIIQLNKITWILKEQYKMSPSYYTLPHIED